MRDEQVEIVELKPIDIAAEGNNGDSSTVGAIPGVQPVLPKEEQGTTTSKSIFLPLVSR